jgi:MoxR-like ATPase
MTISSTKAVDDRIAKKLAEAMKKARGTTETTAPVAPEPVEPVVPKEPLAKFKDDVKGKKFSDVFGASPPNGMPDLKAPVYKHTDWDKGDRQFIPNREDFSEYVPDIGVLYKLWVSVLRNNKKALVVGPTGSGKSSLQKYFCAFINQPLFSINGRGDMESDTILGRPWVENGSMRFEKGELVKAAEKGWWILIDEPWKLPSPIQMALQRFYEKDGKFQLDDMPGDIADKMITPKPSCRVVLCDNVVGTGDNVDQYSATMIQDGSTLNRIDVVLRQEYMKVEDEVQMLKLSVPENSVHTDDIRKLVDFVRLCRTSYEQRALSAALSPRNLLTIAELTVQLGSMHSACQWTLLERFSDDLEKQLVSDHYRTVFDMTLV